MEDEMETETDIYKGAEDLLEDDGISVEEEAFMAGYEEALD